MFKVTHAENQSIIRNAIKDITREHFKVLSYTEGREYAILNLRQMEQEALERGDNSRQSAYCTVLWEIYTGKL